jgi:long-subunit fatty acid transport protein
MKKILLITILISLVAVNLSALFEAYPTSARARGMANAFYTLSDDSDAAFYNPAGLDQADNQFSFNMVDLYGNKYLRAGAFSASYRFSPVYGVLAIAGKQLGVEYEDTDLSTENTLTLAHSFKLMKDLHSSLAFGYSFNMYQLDFAEGYGDDTAYGLNVGAIATMHQRTKISFTVQNINNPDMGKDEEFELPRQMVTGISYQPYYGVVTILELTKELKGDTSVAAGIEYSLLDNMTLRAGVHNNPAVYSAGLGFDVKGMLVNYGFTYHSDLDPTHHFQVGYRF